MAVLQSLGWNNHKLKLGIVHFVFPSQANFQSISVEMCVTTAPNATYFLSRSPYTTKYVPLRALLRFSSCGAHYGVMNPQRVVRTGFEPAHLSALDPKSSMSTNFTTWLYKKKHSEACTGSKHWDLLSTYSISSFESFLVSAPCLSPTYDLFYA